MGVLRRFTSIGTLLVNPRLLMWSYLAVTGGPTLHLAVRVVHDVVRCGVGFGGARKKHCSPLWSRLARELQNDAKGSHL